MPLNKTKAERRAQRRRRVAQLLVRRPRITVREIRRALFKDGHFNPETEEPWSVGTIQKDVEAVRKEAREEMRKSADEWRAKELRRLQQLQQEAWDEGNHKLVLRCMKRRAKMLGLDEPEQVDLTTDGEQITTIDFRPPSEQEPEKDGGD